MPHALNLTIPLRQDAATKAALAELRADFATTIQKKIEDALRESRKVHFARVLIIHDQYLQVITEYDGDHMEYTEFFREKLPDVFARLFSLAAIPPSADDMGSPDDFFRIAASCHIPSLGESVDRLPDAKGGTEGYLFSAYGSRTVAEVLEKLKG